MRAAFYETNGPARDVLRVEEVETPQPLAGEVRVKVVRSGVNPSDVKARAGLTRKISFPRVIPHSDGAGEIDAVGPGVSPTRLGERVWLWNGQWKRAFGTCAEYIVLPESQAVHLPAHIDYEAGACLGIPAMTAAHAIAVADVWAGSTLLIPGGAGAVGHYAIQFAKARGAVVIATASSSAKARLAELAGADHVIDYKRENVGERVRDLTDNAGVDAVIELDLAGNAAMIPGVLCPRGNVVVYGTGNPGIGGGAEAVIPAQWLLVNAAALKFIFVYELTADERTRAVNLITESLEQKRLLSNVGRTLPLSEIAQANELVEQGSAQGNVVVSLD